MQLVLNNPSLRNTKNPGLIRRGIIQSFLKTEIPFREVARSYIKIYFLLQDFSSTIFNHRIETMFLEKLGGE